MRTAADSIRQSGLEDQIRRSGDYARPGSPSSFLQDRERDIQQGIASASRQVDRAAQAGQAAQGQQTGNRLLDSTRSAVLGAQSIQNRLQQFQEQRRLNDSLANRQNGAQRSEERRVGKE